MSFDADWLDLREPADAESRARALERLLAERLRAAAQARGDGAVEIVDLGCGTASNLRHLAPRLAPILHGVQRWTLVDSDARLLATVPEHLSAWAARQGTGFERDGELVRVRGDDLDLEVRTHRADLAQDPLPVAGGDLVTGSALLDLVSEAWLAGLANRLPEVGAAALFALSYDGLAAWQPHVAGDEEIVKLVNQHQRTDKGFGPALGPDAAATAARLFEARGLSVEEGRSDWRLGPGDQALQQHLHAGWAAAASEMAPHRAEAIQTWLARRIDLLEAGQGHVTVGHLDTLALP